MPITNGRKRSTNRRQRHASTISALGPLRTAESTFYRVGVSVEEARCILDEQLANLTELADTSWPM